MQQDAFVVVFPTELAAYDMPLLMRNIKKILELKEQPFQSIERDADIITVRASDPVFAASSVNQLFGISETAIARRVENGLGSVASETARLAGNLLLRDERFLIKITGKTVGYMPKDAELQATSKIIEQNQAVPGTEGRHDRLLRTHITKNHAYVCIFEDAGLGGVPNRSRRRTVVCPVYDGLSAISAIEACRQGYDIHLVGMYGRSGPLRAAKCLDRVARYLMSGEVEMDLCRTAQTNIMEAARVCIDVAARRAIQGIALPLMGQFSAKVADDISQMVHSDGRVLYTPLSGQPDNIRELARRYVLDKSLDPIRVHRTQRAAGRPYTTYTITIRPGPNTIHDILDTLGAAAKINAGEPAKQR